MNTSKSYINVKFPKANTNIKSYKWLLGMTQTRIYSCVCPECNKDYFDYIYGDMDRYMFEDNLPQYCPNCGELMLEEEQNSFYPLYQKLEAEAAKNIPEDFRISPEEAKKLYDKYITGEKADDN